MNDDLDIELYFKYLNGDKEAFGKLYSKYKSKIHYFVFNIVKDYQKAEDITQEVFIYILNNKIKEGYSFKYYIYLVAQSRAISYINVKNRRDEIIQQYLFNNQETMEKDSLEYLIEKENKNELLDEINKLDDKYKNAIYLIKIEGLSYKEAASILGQTVQNIKNLVHRGKKILYKSLVKKQFNQINKMSKILIFIILLTLTLFGVVYATIIISNDKKQKLKITPTYTSNISTIDTNKVWVGTFNLVWNDLVNEVVGKNIEFEDGQSILVDELNKQSFTTEQLSLNSYFKIHGEETTELKNKIEQGIKEKFNEESSIINKFSWKEVKNAYILYAMLKKEFNYLEKFSILKEDTFGMSDQKVKYFGVEGIKEYNESVEVLFYNSKEDFAVKLNTKEGEEVYLYRTKGENKTFEENFNEMLEKKESYFGEKYLQKNDILKIPFIKVKDEINYDELCGKYIKGTNMYISQAIQTIEFELNNVGGSVKSEAIIEVLKRVEFEKDRELIFNDTFILYLKEQSKEKPYLALRVDDVDVLESI